ncbi:hypothetical protein Moror_9197 [Moniliophthora roreri MCA 2997]|uniref:Uncharacterized protein n=1 Tax=Moniliophthora roreri (strain MCA 2997) TaxID=1381753 RepID=V2WWQ2_MONRO|nr:hypothetical protein Moror_9197 [Moniliophthora roreri MCA 2997]
MPSIHKPHPAQWKHLTWGKACAFLVMVATWIFILVSGILMTGISKALNYAFLVEKVYIVWSSGCSTPRFRTKVYKICSVSLLVYFGMAIDGFVRFRTSYITEEGGCVFGYKGIAAFLLETYNLVQNIAFALIGTLGGVMMSSVNATALLVLGGVELAWMCMTFCVLEATINAWILDWVNSGSESSMRNHLVLTEIEISAEAKTGSLTALNTDYTDRDECTHEQPEIIDFGGEQDRQACINGKRTFIVYPKNVSAGRRCSV